MCLELKSFGAPAGGKIMKVKGFDFSKAEKVGRGGVISTEIR